MDDQKQLPPPDPAEFVQLAEPVTRATEAVSRGLMTIAEQNAKFVQTRMQRTTETLSEMSRSVHPTKLAEVQINWWTTTLRDYQEHQTRILQVSSQIMENMVGNARDAMGTIRNVASKTSHR